MGQPLDLLWLRVWLILVNLARVCISSSTSPLPQPIAPREIRSSCSAASPQKRGVGKSMTERDPIVAEFLIESYEGLNALDQNLVLLEEDP